MSHRQEAFNRDYPYLASLKTFPNGHSQLAIDESESSQEGNFILTQTQIDDIFAEAAGIVFYYTTGNEDLYEVHKDGDPNAPVIDRIALWRAPQFTIDQNAITSSISGRYFGNIEAGTVAQTGASVLIRPSPVTFLQRCQPTQTTQPSWRDYRLLEPGQKVSEFLFQFAKSKVVSVDNAQFCIGAFDQLSYLAHFNDDGSPKTKTVTYTRTPPAEAGDPDPDPNATQEIPTIFTDRNIEFSKLATTVHVDSAENTNVAFGGNSGGRFKTTQSPTSFLVVEESMITTKDKDLSFKAWCDFSFEPLRVIDTNTRASAHTPYDTDYWHIKKPNFFAHSANGYYGWYLSDLGSEKGNSMPPGFGLTSDIRQIARGDLVGRNIKNVQISENSFNGMYTGTGWGTSRMFGKYATTITIEFYEPLNSSAQPTPILQVYSDYPGNRHGSKVKYHKDYTQPTPSPDQIKKIVPLDREVGAGQGDDWKKSISQPPPAVSVLESDDSQTYVKLLVEYGNESEFADVELAIGVGNPIIPERIKIVVGFLENSYNRHV